MDFRGRLASRHRWPVMRWRSLEYKAAHLPVTATFLEAWTEFQHAASEDERQSLISRAKARGSFPVPEVSRDRALCAQCRLRVLQARGLPDARHASANDAGSSVSRNTTATKSITSQPCSPRGTNSGLSADIPRLSLTGRIAHFDLTYIPESNKQLKELAGFLIANYGRQHIITLPRGKRKRVIFEEVARTLDIRGR